MKIYKGISRVLSVILICAVLSSVFAGCGETKVSETQIWDDIIAQDSFFEEYGLEITDKEITQRKTMTDQKYDDIYAVVTAQNSDCIYEAEYSLNYILYDDGWFLEDYFKEGYNTIARTACPLSISEEYIREKWNDEISALHFDRVEGVDNDTKHYYTAEVAVSDIVTEIYEIYIYCDYDIDDGWEAVKYTSWSPKLADNSELIDKKWSLSGKYTDTKSDCNLNLEIKNFSYDNQNQKATAEISYSFISYVTDSNKPFYEDDLPALEANKTYSSNGFKTVELTVNENTLSYKVDYLFEIDIYGCVEDSPLDKAGIIVDIFTKEGAVYGNTYGRYLLVKQY